MRHPTITVPRAQELITCHHARIQHHTTAETEFRDGAEELRRRMLLIVTVPPHDEAEQIVFDLQLDHDQLHPLRREWLEEVQRYTAGTREHVRRVLAETGAGVSLGMLAHGFASLAFPSLGPAYARKRRLRTLLDAEGNAAVQDELAVISEVFGGQIGGGNPDTNHVWRQEENSAHRAWLSGRTIDELHRRYREGRPLEAQARGGHAA